MVLKALAFADRGEPKDAYGLVYVIRHTPQRGQAIASRLHEHAGRHPDVVTRAPSLLERDFDGPDGLGPTRAADLLTDPEQHDTNAADAHGLIDDLVRISRARPCSLKRVVTSSRATRTQGAVLPAARQSAQGPVPARRPMTDSQTRSRWPR